jgi:hypothetical protein
MDTLKAILYWLDGKKSTILAITALILSYMVTAGTIDAGLGTLIQAILSVLTGGAIVATKQLGAGK